MIVLSTATKVRRNPWLAEWLKASAAAGFEERPLSTRALLRRPPHSPAGMHLQWPERALLPRESAQAVLNLVRLLLQVLIARLRRFPVILTVHNVTGHDQQHPRLEKAMWRLLASLVTDVRLLSLAGRPEVLARHPRLQSCRWHVIPHGDYPFATAAVELAGSDARHRARHELGIRADARVISTFGSLKAYKGAEDLFVAFRRWPDADAVLLALGKPSTPADERRLTRAASQDDRTVLETENTSDSTLLLHLAASDLVVLPYKAVLNSGSALLALSAGRPVLMPATPTSQELADRCGRGWVLTYSGTLTSETLASAAGSAHPPQERPDLTWCSWPSITREIGLMWGRATAGERRRGGGRQGT